MIFDFCSDRTRSHKQFAQGRKIGVGGGGSWTLLRIAIKINKHSQTETGKWGLSDPTGFGFGHVFHVLGPSPYIKYTRRGTTWQGQGGRTNKHLKMGRVWGREAPPPSNQKHVGR